MEKEKTPSAAQPAKSNDANSEQTGQRLEYQLLRAQISDADKTCVTTLGVLLGATVTLAGVGAEATSPAIVWMIAPLWLIGHMYLTEKRLVILRTAYYLREKIEAKHPGLEWEHWLNTGSEPTTVRYRPFLLESFVATAIVTATPLIVVAQSDWNVTDGPWFALSLATLAVYFVILARSVHGWHKMLDSTSKPVSTPGSRR